MAYASAVAKHTGKGGAAAARGGLVGILDVLMLLPSIDQHARGCLGLLRMLELAALQWSPGSGRHA